MLDLEDGIYSAAHRGGKTEIQNRKCRVGNKLPTLHY